MLFELGHDNLYLFLLLRDLFLLLGDLLLLLCSRCLQLLNIAIQHSFVLDALATTQR